MSSNSKGMRDKWHRLLFNFTSSFSSCDGSVCVKGKNRKNCQNFHLQRDTFSTSYKTVSSEFLAASSICSAINYVSNTSIINIFVKIYKGT